MESLKAEIREELGKGAAKALRRSGWLPAVVYGRGEPPVTIKLSREEFNEFYRRSGQDIMAIELSVNGDARVVMVQEYQRNVVTGKIVHVDFRALHEGEKLSLTVPVTLEGKPPGVVQGGVLEHVTRNLHINCLPSDIPKNIPVDISDLNIGDAVHLSDIAVRNVELLDPEETVIVTCVEPRVVVIEEPEPEEVEGEEGAEAAPEEGEGEDGGEGAKGEKAEGE